MTSDDALKLKVGDRIEARYGKTGWRLVEVVKVVACEQLPDYSNDGWIQMRKAKRRFGDVVKVGDVMYVDVRSVARGNKGQRSPSISKPLSKLRLRTDTLDPVAGNVYADFLEENGFDKAAEALRKRFPLATGEG